MGKTDVITVLRTEEALMITSKTGHFKIKFVFLKNRGVLVYLITCGCIKNK